jgi:hypothetical protein
METTVDGKTAMLITVPAMDPVSAQEGGFDYAVITSVSRGRSSYVEFDFNYVVHIEEDYITYLSDMRGTCDGETAIKNAADDASRRILESIVYHIEDAFDAVRKHIARTLTRA